MLYLGLLFAPQVSVVVFICILGFTRGCTSELHIPGVKTHIEKRKSKLAEIDVQCQSTVFVGAVNTD